MKIVYKKNLKKRDPVILFTRIAEIVILVVLLSLFLSCTQNEEKKALVNIEKAEQYFEQNRFSHAMIELRNAVQLDPENVRAHLLLGNTYIKLENQEKAIYHYRQAEKFAPENIEVQLRIGEVYIREKDLIKARKIAYALLKQHPDKIDAYHLLAGIQIKERKPESAIATMKKAVAQAPAEYKPNMFLAHLYDTTGKKDLAEAAYLKTIAIDPGKRPPYLELSKLYLRQKKTAQAEAILKKMTQSSGDKVEKFLDLARFYEQRKKFELAENAYKKAVSSSPEDVYPLMRLSEFFVRVNQKARAVDTAQKALALNNKTAEVLTGLAQIHLHFKAYDLADSFSSQALELDPELPGALFVNGRLKMGENEFFEAFERFDTILKINPYHAKAHYYKAICILKKGARQIPGQEVYRAAAGLLGRPELYETVMVKDHLKAAVMIDPEFEDARIILAGIYLAEENLAKAREQLSEILRLNPKGARTLNLICELKFLEGDLEGAEHISRLLLKMDPENGSEYLRLGRILRASGKKQEALVSFKNAIDSSADKVSVLNSAVDLYLSENRTFEAAELINRYKTQVDQSHQALIRHLEGKIAMKKGLFQKAHDHYNASIELDPDYLPSYMSQAGLLLKENLYEQALPLYQKVIEKKPDHIPALMAMGYVYDLQGDFKAAEAFYRKVLAIDPKHVNAVNNLAFILADTELGIDEAHDLASRARGNHPKNPQLLDTMGWIYYQKGSYKSAISEYQDSLAIDPDNAVTQYHLGLAFYRMQEFEKSRKYFETALAIDPQFKGADTARQLLD